MRIFFLFFVFFSFSPLALLHIFDPQQIEMTRATQNHLEYKLE